MLSLLNSDGVDSVTIWFSPDNGNTFSVVESFAELSTSDVTNEAKASTYAWKVPDSSLVYNAKIKIFIKKPATQLIMPKKKESPLKQSLATK